MENKKLTKNEIVQKTKEIKKWLKETIDSRFRIEVDLITKKSHCFWEDCPYGYYVIIQYDIFNTYHSSETGWDSFEEVKDFLKDYTIERNKKDSKAFEKNFSINSDWGVEDTIGDILFNYSKGIFKVVDINGDKYKVKKDTILKLV